jgi:hypothetical protein
MSIPSLAIPLRAASMTIRQSQVLVNNSAVVTESVLLTTLAALRSELVAYFLGEGLEGFGLGAF